MPPPRSFSAALQGRARQGMAGVLAPQMMADALTQSQLVQLLSSGMVPRAPGVLGMTPEQEAPWLQSPSFAARQSYAPQSGATISQAPPTPYQDALWGAGEALGLPPRITRKASEALDWTPVGAAGQALDASAQGDPYGTILGAAGIGLPGAGVAGRTVAKGAEKAAQRWYHGSGAKISAFDRPDPVYMTPDYQQAEKYAGGVHLGGTAGEPRVYEVTPREGDALNIDDDIFGAMDEGLDIEDGIQAGIAKARETGARYVEFTHPNAGAEGEHLVRVSLYPHEDLAMAADPAGRLPALDMSEAATQARAKEMGFTTDAYHGTPDASWSEFDPSKMQRMGYGAGLHAAAHPNLANMFAAQAKDGGAVMPLKLRLGKVADQATYKKFAERFDYDPKATTQALLDAGYDSVKYNHGDFYRPVEGQLVQSGPGDDVSYAILRPENIRSRFAAFDPAKKGSSDLLASLAAALGGTGAGMAAYYGMEPKGGA